jgi:hypothetical protein
MKWLYLLLFVALNYALSVQLMGKQTDAILDAGLILLMILLGLLVKVRSRKRHPRIYAFAWGMFYGNILSFFLLAGYFTFVLLSLPQ